LDVALPVAVMLCGAFWLGGPTARSPGAVVHRQVISAEPSASNATLWFYDWVARALAQGLPIARPDGVCAPHGTTLGGDFQGWADAILAAPLMHALPFPAGFNLFLALIPVLGGLASYYALRSLTQRRLLALAGACLFGFNSYTATAIAQGRPGVALIAIIPLFLAAWMKATEDMTKQAACWALIAGFLAGLAVYFDLVYALTCWLLGALLLLGRTLVPPQRAWREWPGVAAVLALVVCIGTSAPWLYQATVLQERFPAPSAELVNPERSLQAPAWVDGSLRELDPHLLPPWDAELWRFTWAFVQDRGRHVTALRAADPGPPASDLDAMAGHALAPTWFLQDGGAPDEPRGMPPLPWLVPLTFALALVAGSRAWGWAIAALALYSLTLGPSLPLPLELSDMPGSTADGQLRLPLWYAARFFPGIGELIQPSRVVPSVLLAVTVTLVVSLEVLARRSKDALTRFWPIAPSLLWPLVAAALLVAVGRSQHRHAATLADPVSWEPWTFHERLAGELGPGAIIELPLGLGRTLGGFQAIHGRARADQHRDAVLELRRAAPPPSCYQEPLLTTLWSLGRDPEAPAVLNAGEVSSAAQAGFRWVVVYADGYEVMERYGIHHELERIQSTLDSSLGPPVHADDRIEAYELPTSASRGR